MDQLRLDELKKQLLDLVPVGSSKGNAAVRDELKRVEGNALLSDEEFWLVRNALIDDGVLERGRGRGGSVHRVESQVPVAQPSEPSLAPPPEADYYDSFLTAVQNGYVKDNDIKRYVAEVTARQGRRKTGGKWTRPDITLVAIRTFSYLPKQLEVISFEIKPSLGSALEGVFEAAAHTAFAHRSYLAFPNPSPDPNEPFESPLFDRVIDECERFGIGLILFGEKVEWDSFDFQVTARRHNPDPTSVDRFINTQLSTENERDLRDLLA
jgi:hypothetical protein